MKDRVDRSCFWILYGSCDLGNIGSVQVEVKRIHDQENETT